MLVSVSHPSQDQQTTADEGTFHYAALSPVIEYVAPASAVTNTELSLSLH